MVVRLTMPVTSPLPAVVAETPIVNALEPVERLPVKVKVEFTVRFAVAEVVTVVLEIVKSLNVVMLVPAMVCPDVPLNVTAPVPAVKVLLFVQLPVRLRVLELPSNVPAVSVTLPLMVWDNEVPRFNVPPPPFIISNAAVTLPVSVAVLAVRTKKSAPVVEKPAMPGVALVPPIIIVEPLAVKVALLIKLPFNVRSKLLTEVLNVPPDIVNVPFTTTAAPNVPVPPPDFVRLLKVVAVFVIACVPLPLKLTVPVLAVNVADPVQLPVRIRALELPSSVPAVSVTLPLMVWDNEAPRFNVPPLPFTVSDAAVTLLVRVAVLAVRTKENAPVVEKPAMLGVALVPPMVTVEPLAVNVALLVKFPFNVKAKLLPEVLSVPAVMVRSPFTVVTPPSVAVCPDLSIVR